MTPHRAALAADTATVGAVGGATVGAALLGIVTGASAWLFAALVVVQVLDVLTGTSRARRSASEVYDPNLAVRGMHSKLRRLSLVVVGLALDTALLALSSTNAQGTAHLVPVLAYGWVTTASIAWLLRVEVLSVLDNVRRTEGVDVLFPGALAALKQIDAQLYQREHAEPLPARRHTDVALAEMTDTQEPEGTG
jgi:hypothetical protein